MRALHELEVFGMPVIASELLKPCVLLVPILGFLLPVPGFVSVGGFQIFFHGVFL